MNYRKQLAAALASGALLLGMLGLSTGAALAASVEPIFHDGNITVDGGGNNDKADCDKADAIFLNGGDNPDLEGTSDNGVTVTITIGDDNSIAFVADGGLVTIAYVKGSSGYNEYNYGSPGVASDEDLFSPDAGGSGGAAALSHLIFCTGPETATTTTTEETTTTTEETTTTTTEETTTTTTEEATTTTSFSQSVGGETDAASQPDTATFSGSGTTGAPSDGSWMLILAAAMLIASLVILTPAPSRRRR